MKNIISTLIILFAGVSAYSQMHRDRGDHGENREKILQMKVAYVRENLGLTETENKRFIPVYEEYLKKEEQLRQKQRGMMRGIKQTYTQMSDADIEKTLTDEMAVEQQLLDMKKAQFEAFKKLIPIKKVVELRIVERSFNKMLMENMRDKKGNTPAPIDEK